jgi:hypothetical protein
LIPCGLQSAFWRQSQKKVKNAFFCKKSVLKTYRRFFVFGDLCQNRVCNEQNEQPARAKADTKRKKNMKKRITPILVAGLILAGGCSTPVSLSGDYTTPKQTVSGAVSTTTNGVTVSGAYSTTNQTVGGSVTIEK